ncbi:HAD-IA family hydrolase [Acinetobacter baumannii]|uniref:HAD-IA family hydrolase n=1 Tax=Acinetobacter baumannii TaxID=470 RepID=UPI00056FAE4E|nr:HAD-IA family hydrolase [Acinetobacter baumannii]MDH2654669.1 HAD-IA family hydrolase [Acinetobacter baumannii]
MEITAVLFDLDNTIANTSTLQETRENHDTAALAQLLTGLEIHDAANRLINFLAEQNVKLGIVTNSPRWYAEALLRHFGIFEKFQSIVTYNEVTRFGIKPSPNGIKLALAELDVSDPSKVIYIGDEGKDIVASYYAGVLPVIGSWTNREPLSDTPFGVFSYKLIKKHFPNYKNISLIAENCAREGSYSAPAGEVYFLPLDSNGNVISTPENLTIFCFGRYFSQKNEITVRLHDSHKLSLDIFEKEDALETYTVPSYWNHIFSNLIKNIGSYPKSKIKSFQVVTVVPAKNNKIKRLEQMLKAISKDHPNIMFIEDLLYFDPGAPSLKSLPKIERLVTLKKYLKFNPKYTQTIINQNILILDDVITTGSTMKVARELLLNLNAREVLGACIAKTVSLQRDFKTCPSCNSELFLLKNRKDGSRFWSCPKKDELGNYCGYKENMKEKDCPECGRPMYRKRNNNDQSIFLACSGYYGTPFCNHTENLENL